jgi:hypothetical protein
LVIKVYNGFYVKAYEGKNGTKYYLCAQGGEIYKHSFTAPENALVYLYYSTGSRSHTYHAFTQWFRVVKQVSKVSLTFDDKGYTSRVEAENLQPLSTLDDKTLAEAEAEILNMGLTPSQYDPVRSIYCYAKQLNLANLSSLDLASLKPGQTVTIPFAAQPQPTTQTQPTQDIIESLKAEITKKRQELAELEAQLQALLMKQGLEQLKEAVVD